MKIKCPLLGDEELCNQPMRVRLTASHPGTRHEPGDGPSLADVEGLCRHAREWNAGDLNDPDQEFLLEYVLNKEYELCQE